MLATLRSVSGRRARTLLLLLGIAAITTNATACDGTSTVLHRASPASSEAIPTGATTTTAEHTQVDADKDNDVGAPYDDTNNARALAFGHTADPSQRRLIAGAIKRYYTAALAGDSAKGCAMITSADAETLAEDYGEPPGPSYMRGAKTCVQGMTMLFDHIHTRLASEVPALRVMSVRLDERRAIALLSFGALPEREISMTHEARVWKISTLTDGELP
jgi:hypothetical protein